MKEDELEELRELNRHLQTLLKEKDESEDILKHNFNVNRYLSSIFIDICRVPPIKNLV